MNTSRLEAFSDGFDLYKNGSANNAEVQTWKQSSRYNHQ